MVTTIILYLGWIIYTLLESLRESFYWEMKSRTSYNKDLDLHPFFALQRGLVILLMCILQYNNGGLIHSLVYFACASLMFPFIHNGMYYTTRNYLDKNLYPKKWFDQSVTSTSKLTYVFTPLVRTICFIVATVCIFIF